MAMSEGARKAPNLRTIVQKVPQQLAHLPRTGIHQWVPVQAQSSRNQIVHQGKKSEGGVWCVRVAAGSSRRFVFPWTPEFFGFTVVVEYRGCDGSGLWGLDYM